MVGPVAGILRVRAMLLNASKRLVEAERELALDVQMGRAEHVRSGPTSFGTT